MKRSELLKRLPYSVPESAMVRMVVDTDTKNEADDQFAIVHHLLTPIFDVRAVTAAHFEQKDGYQGQSMEKSYQEAVKILALSEIADVPVLRGCPRPLTDAGDAPDGEGVDFLIAEARREDPRPLFVAVQGAMTNVAAALNRAPDIADKLTVIWNGGGPYPQGRPEFNVMQDPAAVRALLCSSAAVWQVPQDVYARFEVSLSEIARRVAPCGELGRYLMEQLSEQSLRDCDPHFRLRTGDNWTLGDNTTIAVLLESELRDHWTVRPAPILAEDLTYRDHPSGRPIRVYHDLDARLALEDLFAKLELVCGRKNTDGA